MKILYFDVETTGTSSYKHDITQFAAIVEIDGVVVEEINWRCQPTHWENISPQALQVTGITLEQLKTYDLPQVMFSNIKKLFQKYIPKYSKNPDRFYPAGHNVAFDLDFLNAFFKQHGDADDKQWGITTYTNWRSLDSRIFANFMAVSGKLETKDNKLSTLSEHFKVEINAHDALSDIKATREIIKIMMGKIV